MNLSRLVYAVGVLTLIGAPAFSQAPNAVRQEAPVRIQSSITFFVFGPTGDGEEAQRLRDRARRTVYEMAGRECDLVREVFARECRLESVNVNIGRQYGSQQPEGYQVNGSMSLQTFPK
jgi:hypothetical protein